MSATRQPRGGVVKNVRLDYVPEVEVGDYTIVHVGFAISKIDEETAKQTLEDFRTLGLLDEELASEEEAFARAAQSPQSPCLDCHPIDKVPSSGTPIRSCGSR